MIRGIVTPGRAAACVFASAATDSGNVAPLAIYQIASGRSLTHRKEKGLAVFFGRGAPPALLSFCEACLSPARGSLRTQVNNSWRSVLVIYLLIDTGNS